METTNGTSGSRPRSTWSEELRVRYLAMLRETGNGRDSARRLGHPHIFTGRRARDPVFRRQCEEAVAEAEAQLGQALSAFPSTEPLRPNGSFDESLGPLEFKSMPSGDEPPGSREPVIRRTSNGRIQISYVREADMTSTQEAEFLALLRATGNFEGSAAAIGFHASTLYRRIRRWPDFARRCEQARDEADVELEYKLVGQAHALLRRPGEVRLEGEDEMPFDPEAAIRILHFLDRRRAGRLGGRPLKGPPERSFEQAVESILAKVDAIDRHRKFVKEQEEKADRERGDDP
ncbi:MAG TPA: hypothetical protein VF645_13480 [Allosphingosinicella sp.]|jgi:hypothetical protein